MIKELMPENLIVLDLEKRDKKGAIQELARLLVKERRVDDVDIYIEAVMKREEEYSTGIGFGVAIPHGQSDVVKQSSLCFGRSVEGIEYDSIDGKLVHLLFLIAVPNSSKDEHLKILSKLSRKLMHQEVRERLLKAAIKEEVYAIVEEE